MSKARSSAEIVAELIFDIMTFNPRINYWAPLSINRSFVEPIGKLAHTQEQLIYDLIDNINPLYAKGAYLDVAVRDRLLDGRHPGAKATGQVTFYRDDELDYDIIIPSGTQVVATIETPGAPDEYVLFETIEQGILVAGDVSCLVMVQAIDSGVEGNVVAHSISNIITPPAGIQYVDNPLNLTGGSAPETDEELLDRYIYAPRVTGRATPLLIKEHLESLEAVQEAQVYSSGLPPGYVECVVDTPYTTENVDAVTACIRQNLAGGISSRGVLAATIRGSNIVVGLDNAVVGRIWFECKEDVQSVVNISFTYKNEYGYTRSGSVSIPAGTREGTGVLATLEPGDYGSEILSIDYTGTQDFNVNIGLGDFNYLFVTPEPIYVSCMVPVYLTDTPETGLLENMKASVEAFLDGYKIGEHLYFSDLHDAYLHDYTDDNRRAFVGIDHLGQTITTGNGQTMFKDGDEISVQRDQRILAGQVNISDITP